jgi:PmbA protein
LLTRLDRPIAAPAVTLVDDGALASGLKSRPFDDEGTPTGATTLIERGTLRALLHTLDTAGRLGMAPNGKAVRPNLWQQPRSAPSNVSLQPGDADPGLLRQELRRGLAVVNALRPGRLHSATGKLTAIVQGWWVEEGVPVRPVSGVPLSANIFELLRDVRRCGRDLQHSPLADGAGAPSLLVERMQVG